MAITPKMPISIASISKKADYGYESYQYPTRIERGRWEILFSLGINEDSYRACEVQQLVDIRIWANNVETDKSEG